MSRPKPTRPPAQVATRQATNDTYANFEARVGLGTANQNSASTYAITQRITQQRPILDDAYRTSWICGAAVDTVADDMTRAGIEIKSDDPIEDSDNLLAEMEVHRVWDSLNEGIKWGRLYGGAVGWIMIDGQRSDTPLNIDSIGRGQFRGILPLDRWTIMPDIYPVITDLGPDLGKPVYYTVIANAMGLPTMKIHHSRLIRFHGVPVPYWQKLSLMGWDQSVLERVWDRLLPFDSTTQGAAQLVYKAHLRVMKVKDLRSAIAFGGPAQEAIIRSMDFIRRFQSNEGMTVIDSEDEFEAHQYTFSGLDSVLIQMAQQISGALQIPLTRLFGQSPSGMNATGESDMRNYYESIAQRQDRGLRTGLTKVLNVMYRSLHGRPPPDGWGFSFVSLMQLDDVQKADVTQKRSDTIVKVYDSGMIDRATALAELRAIASITGAWSKITDEQIAEAEDDPPPTIENPDGLPNAQPGDPVPAPEPVVPGERPPTLQ